MSASDGPLRLRCPFQRVLHQPGRAAPGSVHFFFSANSSKEKLLKGLHVYGEGFGLDAREVRAPALSVCYRVTMTYRKRDADIS
jgi:hypothetical protein